MESKTDRPAASVPDPPDSLLLQKSPSQQSVVQEVMLILRLLHTVKEKKRDEKIKVGERLLSNKRRPYAQ